MPLGGSFPRILLYNLINKNEHHQHEEPNMIKRDPKTYSHTELRKMNTDRLMQVHLYLYEAYPATFDREEIIRLIERRTNEGQASLVSTEEAMARWAQGQQKMYERMIKQMGAEVKGTTQPEMTVHEVESIRKMHKAGYSAYAIAKIYNKWPNYINNIIIRKIYDWVA